jgi:esterase/lipase superfamily enzyme
MIPFIRQHCQSPDAGVWTMGASLGAYHAANTLFKHPDIVKRCFALSGVYDMKRFMGGAYDDNFYFNNPVDYLANASDPEVLGRLATCDIHIATGTGPWEHSGESYRLSQVLASRGIHHHLDDWGPLGGHDWPYWKHQMREYLSKG